MKSSSSLLAGGPPLVRRVASLPRERRAAPSPISRVRLTTFIPLLALAAPAAVLAQASSGAELETVVVTASRTPQPLSAVLADVSVIDRATIERSGAHGVAELLARLPGIEFSRSGGPGTATGVFIRGNESRHTAVYIDGVRVDSQSTGGAVWEQLPLDEIERIEVLRGPAAAIYGSDAVAGVVQLFTRRGQGPARARAAVSLGSHGTKKVQAGISGAGEQVDYSLSASHGRSDGFDSRLGPGTNPDDDGWRRNTVQARAGFRFNAAHRIEASLLSSTLRSQYDGFDPDVDDVSRHTLRTGSVSWQADWNDLASTRLLLGQSRSTYESQPSFYRTETTLRNYLLQHDQRIGTSLLTATLERREDELFNPATDYSDALDGERHQNAISLGWHVDLGKHGLQTHLRHDRDSEFGSKSTGSLAWGWHFAPQWRLMAATATSFRAPTLYQRFSQYGNPSLVPESGRNIEVGLRWAAADSEASLRIWRNKLSNLIGFGAAGPCDDPFGCYANTGRARLDGVTLAGRTRLDGMTLRGSLDWHDPRDLETGNILPRRARRLATLGAETRFAGWTVGAEMQAAGMRYEDAGNNQRLGGYGIVNLFASRTLQRGLVLEARLDNAGDKDYELVHAYATPGRAGQITLRWAMP